MDASDRNFEKEMRQATFFYTNMDLSQMGQFRVVRDGQLVNEE